MSEIDANKEWQRLNALYSEMGDEELFELREQFGDLTDVAQGVLRDEMQRRRIWYDLEPVAENGEGHAQADPAEFAAEEAGEAWTLEDLQMGGEVVCECSTSEEADLYRYVLELAKIRAVALHPGQRVYVNLPLVKVAPDDVERAGAVLAKPIPEDVVKDFESQMAAGDFEVPACKKCGSTEVMLESVEPANEWLCDNCGARWQDAHQEAE